MSLEIISLKILLEKNYKDFYDGELASQIINTVKNSDINPGFLSREDMKNYRVRKTKALCVELTKFLSCGPQLPSSGGITIAQALKLYENIFGLNGLYLVFGNEKL